MMEKYKVYVEIFGKKYKIEVRAKNEKQAEEIVKQRLIFHKVEKVSNINVDEAFAKIIKEGYDLLKNL